MRQIANAILSNWLWLVVLFNELSQISWGDEVLKSLLRLVENFDAKGMQDRLEFPSKWKLKLSQKH